MVSCYLREMPYETTIYQREKLYAQVWEHPLVHVAKDYDVSDVALAKTCRRLNVPLPGRGCWSRRAVGKAEVQPKLPALRPGDLAEYKVEKWSSDPPTAADIELRDAIDATPECSPEQVIAPFSIVVPTTTDGLHLDRAARFLSALVTGVEKAGHQVRAWEDYQHPSGFIIDGVRISFWVTERLTRSEHIRKSGKADLFEPKWDFAPTGDLRFAVEWDEHHWGKRQWEDGKKRWLEGQINDIFCVILQTSANHKAAVARREVMARVQQERERRRHELEKRREEERQRVHLLVK